MDKIKLISSTDIDDTQDKHQRNLAVHSNSFKSGMTGTSSALTNFYESDSGIDNNENLINALRIADFQRKFTKEFIKLLREEDFEYGIETKTDIFVKEKFQLNALATRSWINQIFIDHFDDANIVVGILRVIARLEYFQIYPAGQTMAIAAFSHENEEVQECGIRAFENWEVYDSLKVLESLQVKSDWLQDYINNVLVGLRKKFNVVLGEKN